MPAFSYQSSRLAALRVGRNLTVRQLAERVGVSHPTVTRWESGKGVPGLDEAVLLAEALGVQLLDLLSPPVEVTAEGRDYFRGMQDATMTMLSTVTNLQARIGEHLRSDPQMRQAAATAPNSTSPAEGSKSASEVLAASRGADPPHQAGGSKS